MIYAETNGVTVRLLRLSMGTEEREHIDAEPSPPPWNGVDYEGAAEEARANYEQAMAEVERSERR